MAGLAVARLGISVDEFYMMTPAEFFEAISFSNKHEASVLEFYRNNIWESMRFQTMMSYNMVAGNRKAIKDPKKICKFAWDKDIVEPQDVEKQKAILVGIFGVPKRKRKRRTE